MKTLEFIREEIWEEMLRLEDKRKDQWVDIKYRTLREVLQKLGHLDEPEVLSQKWIDENKVQRIDNLRKMTTSDVVTVEKLKNLIVPKQEITFEQAYDKLREESILSEKSFDYYWNCINDNVEIDEPGNILVPKQDKPVIPQFVADWIEVSKKHYSIGAVFHDAYDGKLAKVAIEEYIFENQDLFAQAWLDGYEVEKEQKYHVVNKENYFMLRKYDGLVDILHELTAMSRDKYGKDTRFMLTEQEIKDYDERFWVFAEEVTE